MEVSRMASMERERAYGKRSAQVLRAATALRRRRRNGRRHGWGGTASTNVTGPSWARNPRLVARDQPNR